MSSQATWLLGLLLVGHFLGDFTPLSTSAIQEAKAGLRTRWLIAAHAAVHTALVLAIVWLVVASPATALLAAGFEFATHFAIDVAKMELGRRFPVLRDSTAGAFWTVHGADQLAHALVLLIIAASVT